MGKDLKNKIKRTIIIKGDATKFYEEVIFVFRYDGTFIFRSGTATGKEGAARRPMSEHLLPKVAAG